MHHVSLTHQKQRNIKGDHIYKRKTENWNLERGVKCHILSMMIEERAVKKMSRPRKVADLKFEFFLVYSTTSD